MKDTLCGAVRGYSESYLLRRLDMTATGEGSRSFQQLVIEKMDSMQASLDGKLSEFKEQILSEQRSENERLSKKLKLEKKFDFRRKGNEIQHEFNEKMKATMEEATSFLESEGSMPKAKESLQQGIDDINERQKLIKIPDRSENGWLTAQEYQTDDLAENSDDEKRIARAERQAERRRKKRGTVRGRGNYSFRGQRGRVPESFRPAYYEAVGTGIRSECSATPREDRINYLWQEFGRSMLQLWTTGTFSTRLPFIQAGQWKYRSGSRHWSPQVTR